MVTKSSTDIYIAGLKEIELGGDILAVKANNKTILLST